MIGLVFTNIFSLFSSYSLAATSGLISERSGVVNIAIDGKMIIGGLIWAVLMEFTGIGSMGNAAPFIAMLLAGVGAMFYSAFLSIPVVSMYSDHVITGTAVNMIAGALALIIMFALTNSTVIGIPGSMEMSMGWAGEIDTTAIIYLIIAVSVILAVGFVLSKTKWGLRLKTAGENPYSLASAGVSVAATKYIALAFAGFLSGIAGSMALLTMGNQFGGGVNGIGYVALAILIFSRYTTFGIMFGTIIVATLMGLARSWGLIGAVIPREIMQMFPFIIPIISLVVMKKFYLDKGKGAYGGAPKAVGQPFKKDQR